MDLLISINIESHSVMIIVMLDTQSKVEQWGYMISYDPIVPFL